MSSTATEMVAVLMTDLVGSTAIAAGERAAPRAATHRREPVVAHRPGEIAETAEHRPLTHGMSPGAAALRASPPYVSCG
jgi:hypothetical protein